MITFLKVKKLCSSLLLFTSLSALTAETFRVAETHTVKIEETVGSEATCQMTMYDGMAIFLPENPLYLQGIELSFVIPESIAVWRDCTGFYLYDNISPVPSEQQIDYSGKRIWFDVLPGRLSWIVQIPLGPSNKMKTDKYTTKIDTVPDIENGFIFFKLQQIMKGIPDEVMDALISVTVKPMLADKGLLTFDLKEEYPNSVTDDTTGEVYNQLEDTTFFIDENAYPIMHLNKDGILLDTGIHNISVINPYYRTEVRTVRIDQAKTTAVEVTLKSIEPTLLVSAPEGTAVFLDDEPYEITGKETIISEGDHKVKFVIGDYEIVRNLSVSKGKSYSADLAVDLKISEEKFKIFYKSIKDFGYTWR